MKNLLKLFVVALLIVSCDETEPVIFDPETGQTAISFADTTLDLSVPEGGVVVPVEILSTTVSDQDRTYNVTVDPSSTVTTADYSIGTLTIPAGSFVGNLDVTLNYDSLEDFVNNTLVLNLDLPEGTPALSDTITISFVKEFDITAYGCQTLNFDLILDYYGSETSYDIVDDAGNVVYSGGTYSDDSRGVNVGDELFFEPGCYTLTIYDSYGDGQFDGAYEGGYELSCAAQAVVIYASGTGAFGATESTDFCIVAEED